MNGLLMSKATVLKRKQELLGKEFDTNHYGKCVIVEYEGAFEVTVKFVGYDNLVKCTLGWLKLGGVANPMHPSVYGVGYMGIGAFTSRDKRLYSLWVTMLKRVYCPKYHKTQPAYKGTSVCEEWWDFQNFAKWCMNQIHFNSKDERGKSYQLDKDLLVKGNRAYSPDTCCFIPQEINSSIIVHYSDVSKDKVVGIFKHKVTKRYRVFSSVVGGSRVHIGYFKTQEEAIEVYKRSKITHNKALAEKWEGKIDDVAYIALLNRKIEVLY